MFGKNGTASVIQASGEFKKISENQLWDLSNPPSPDSYIEYFPAKGTGQATGHGHAGQHGAAKKQDDVVLSGGKHSGSKFETGSHGGGHTQSHSHGGGEKAGAAMLAGMLKGDKDGDEILSGNEIPKRLSSVMENIDLNGDGQLDKSELEKMAKSFAAKRAGSKQSSRDPIVYGVAADSQGILVRTGTRLYAIGGSTNQ